LSATGESKTGEPAPLEPCNDPVEIRTKTNGPLLLSGAMQLISGTGRTFAMTKSTAPCRGGASANKLFCEGSNNTIGCKS
jgi:hypothetical protein